MIVDVKRPVSNIVLVLAILLLPVYFFESGLPQPAHFLLLIYLLLNYRTIMSGYSPIINSGILLFTLYITVTNIIWYFILSSDDLLKSSSFYLFNFFVFISFCDLLKSRKYQLIMLRTVAFSILIQVIASFIIASNHYRPILLFNNPNQLGYWALLSAIILSLFHLRYGIFRSPFYLLTFFCSGYLTLLSHSRAAIISYSIIFALILSQYIIKYKVFSLSVLLIVLLVGTAYIKSSLSGNEFFNSLTDRFSNIENVDDQRNLGGRGYDRILNHPEFWIFGAGEGEYARFESNYNGELHSSFGTIFFSYGVLGLLIFIIFLWKIAHKSNLKYLIVLCALLIYGIAHMGLRSILFWAVLALMYRFSEFKRLNIGEYNRSTHAQLTLSVNNSEFT